MSAGGGRPIASAAFVIVIAIAIAAPRAARAASPADEAAAEALFTSGKSLMAERRFDEACAKLDASRRLSPGIGITMWLADCHEKAGRLASAWIGFRDAASLARSQGDRRSALAEARASALEPKLARVRVVRGSFVGDVFRDDVRLPDGALDVPAPVDRGRYRYRFVDAGGATREVVVTVSEDGRLYDVRPEEGSLVARPRVADAPAPKARKAEAAGHDRTLGFVFFGVAAIGAGVGAGFGLDAASKKRQSNDGHCSGNLCDTEGVGLRDDAFTSATISTIAFATSAVALAAGAAIFLGLFDGSALKTTARARGALTW